MTGKDVEAPTSLPTDSALHPYPLQCILQYMGKSRFCELLQDIDRTEEGAVGTPVGRWSVKSPGHSWGLAAGI